MASGANRVDEKKLAAALNQSMPGESIGKADADFVRAETGFAIGGVSPVGHGIRLKTLIDEDLMALSEIWAAAGSPHSVFRLTPHDLQRITQGQILALKAG
jgi:prolyl-tRNA editing enzyme YbaK/EbsC (Cys-tRNA(Pro) deacylase)